MTEAWYAVYTKFQHEKTAASLLEKKELNVFLPVYRAVHRWKDRNQTVILPLFPCYLFLRTNLDRKLDILRTAGVRWIVENAGRACAVPEPEIDAVRTLCSVVCVQPHPFLKQGERVRVRSGALAGIEGILVKLKNHYRVVISVDVLQKSVAVEVDLSNVEAAPLPVSQRGA